MKRVHVIGSINQDIVAEAARHPRPGETVLGSMLRFHPGGKGLNQAVAAARAGASVTLTGCVGDDAAGRELLSILRAAGVDCEAVGITNEAPTGTGVITLAAGENAIVVIAGANALVTPDLSVRIDVARGDICVAQLETPVETTVSMFQRARAAGATTVFNPAPADQVPDELLALSDILVVNAPEFELIFGLAIDRNADANVRVTRRFRGSLVVTLGASGTVVWENGQRTSIPGHQVTAVDSTGAGDCFVGYLVAGLAAGQSLEQAAHTANRAAAISVTRHGAASSIPVAAEVQAL